MTKVTYSIVIALLSLTTVLTGNAALADCPGDTTLTIKEKHLMVEVADTPRERRFGLMFRQNMGENCGMLFVFQSKGVRTFTMRNTLIPLDIAFISGAGEIKEIFTMQPGVERYPSKVESLYALEMNAGWFADNSLEVGSVLSVIKDGAASPITELESQ